MAEYVYGETIVFRLVLITQWLKYRLHNQF